MHSQLEFKPANMECNLNHSGNHVTRPSLIHILIVLVLAFGIRIYFLISFPHVITLNEADGIAYISIARNIVENFSISNSIHFPPFYPSLIALFSLITGEYESAARWVSIVMGSGMVVPMYLACRYFMSSRASFCAALVAACFLPFVSFSLQPISQSTYVMMISLSVWFGLRCVRMPSWSSLAAFGVTSAAIYLTRPEGILFFTFNFPMLVFVIYKDSKSLKLRFSCMFALAAGFFMPFLWYVICLKRFTGKWIISGKSGVTSIGVDESLKMLPSGLTFIESLAGTEGIANLFPSFSIFIRVYIAQLGKFSMIAYSALPGIIFILAAIGITLIAYENMRLKGAVKSVFLFLMFLSPLIMLAPVMAFDKLGLSTCYILPFFCVLICCSAKGAIWLEEMLVRQIEKWASIPSAMKKCMSVSVIATALFSLYSSVSLYKALSSEQFINECRQLDFLLRQTGHVLKNRTDKNAKIMARWSNIGFYGERNLTVLVDGSIDEVTRYAKRNGVTHIVIDSEAVGRVRPQLKDLLEPSIPQAGLLPVYQGDQFCTRVVIYQVL